MTSPSELFALRHVDSFDGTRIRYGVAGTGSHTLVMCPGLGVPLIANKHIVRHFAARYRVVAWEGRGTYQSSPPPRARASLGVDAQVLDLRAIVKAEGLTNFVLGGWSMATQVSLAYAHAYPEECDGLLLINGPFEHVIARALRIPVGHRVVTDAIWATGVVKSLVPLGAIRFMRKNGFMPAARACALVTGDVGFFEEVLEQFETLDLRVWAKILGAMNEHSARPYMHTIRAPALVISGARDVLAPLDSAMEMARLLPNAELFIVAHATHYAMLEYPDQVNAAIDRFLCRVYPETTCDSLDVDAPSDYGGSVES